MKQLTAIVVTVLFIGFLLMAVVEMPALGSDDPITHNEVMDKYIEDAIKDTGAINIVSAIILDYRAFDTFIEASVIFTALIFVMVVIKERGSGDEK